MTIRDISKENNIIGKEWAERLKKEGLLFDYPVFGTGIKLAIQLQAGTIHTYEEAKALYKDLAKQDGLHSYRLHWLGERVEYIYGHDATDAFNRAGIGPGALQVLDYYEEVA